MSAVSLPTPEEVRAIYRQGEDAVVALVAGLQKQLEQLTARVATLEGQVKQDSHNSHQPPSRDGPGKKPRTRSLRKRSGKPSGGQAGHEGVTRLLVADPAIMVRHLPATCAGCGAALADAPTVGQERRQVVELPKPRLEITEHQAVQKACPTCHRVTSGVFPAAVTQPVQYGARAKGVMVYLQTYQLLPYERTIEALRDLFGISPSEGTLTNAQQEAYTQLAPVEAAIGQAICQADVVHVDETGIRVAGGGAWVHVLCTATLTFYAHHIKRGRVAFEAIGLLLTVVGRRVHDAWGSYLTLAGLYALCNAHLLRELIGLDEAATRAGTPQTWITAFIALLLSMKAAVAAAQANGATALPMRQRAGFEAAYTRLLNSGLAANPPSPPIPGRRGPPKQTPTRNLLERLQTHRPAILAFLHDFRVPFDNNQAERDLRMLKVKQKVSGCFRSPQGADYFCRLRGYISTLRKQDYSILDGLTSVFAGQPYMPRLDA